MTDPVTARVNRLLRDAAHEAYVGPVSVRCLECGDRLNAADGWPATVDGIAGWVCEWCGRHDDTVAPLLLKKTAAGLEAGVERFTEDGES